MTENQTLHTVTTAEEARLVAGLAREIWTEHYTPIIGSGQVDYMLEKFQSPRQILEDVTHNGYAYLWLEQDGKPVAYMGYRMDPDGCFLSKLYVGKTWRGSGLARVLIDHLMCCCRREGKQRIWLTVNKNNTDSIRAYNKMMFFKIRSVVTDIGGGYVMDDDVMQRNLGDR